MRCIYCRQENEGSKEHLLPRVLGGNLIARFVCRDCNRALGRCDQAVADAVWISMLRVAHTPREAFRVSLSGRHVCVDPTNGLHIDLRLCNQYRPEVLPQVHFVKESVAGQWKLQVAGSHPAEVGRLASFISEKAENGFDKLHVDVSEAHGQSPPRLVLHRRHDGFLSAASEDEAAEVVALLEKGWSRIIGSLNEGSVDEHELPPPRVQSAQKVDVRLLVRGIAKIALNLLAHRCGAERALHVDFDPIRQFIRYDKGDDGFVRLIEEREPSIPPLDTHQVILSLVSGEMAALVTLYGSAQFVVKLGPTTPELGQTCVYLFRGDRKNWRQLSELEFAKELVARASTTRGDEPR